MKKLCFLIAFLASFPAFAQSYYGKAQFYRSDAWPKDAMKYHWVMNSANEGGEIFYNDLEVWCFAPFATCINPGTYGDSCLACPDDGSQCGCSGAHDPGDIERESTIVYSGNYSAKMYTDVTFSDVNFGVNVPLLAGKTYQLSYAEKGAVGTETVSTTIYDYTLDASYDFSTNSWFAPGTGPVWTNHTASAIWTKYNYTVINDIDRPFVFIGFLLPVPGVETVYFDSIEWKYGPSSIGQLSYCLGGSPEFGKGKTLYPRAGTGPINKTGASFDGIDDCLTCSEADCPTSPTNDFSSLGIFSVGARFESNYLEIFSGFNYPVMAKDGGHTFYLSNTDVGVGTALMTFGVSVDTGALLLAASSTSGDAPSLSKINAVGTYSWAGLTGQAKVYTNGALEGVSDCVGASTTCAPDTSANPFYVGSLDGSTTYGKVKVEEVAIWEKELSEIEASKFNYPYFPAGKISDGFYVPINSVSTTDLGCYVTASHAVCSKDGCTDQSPYSCQPEGAGVMAFFEQGVNYFQNGSFEYFTGTEESPGSFLSAGIYEYNGDGTAKVSMNASDPFHDFYSVQMSLTGTTSYAEVYSTCLVILIGETLYFEIAEKRLSGNPNTSIQIVEYDDGACTGNVLQTDTIVTSNLSTEKWQWVKGQMAAGTWNGSTAGYIVKVVSNGAPSTILFDFANMLYQPWNYFSPPMHNFLAGGTYTTDVYRIHNPLSDYDQANSRYAYTAGFCASAWVYTDWAGNDGYAHFFYYVPTTSGTNNIIDMYKTVGNVGVFYVYDSAGVAKGKLINLTNTNWTAGNWKYIEACSSNTGTVVAHHYNVSNSTWYDWSTADGAGTGIQNGQNSLIALGSSGSLVLDYTSLDGYMSEFNIDPYSATYPNDGFNKGKPPVNNSPY